MKGRWLLVAAIIAALLKVGFDVLQQRPPGPPPKIATPEETLASFMAALRDQSPRRMERLWLSHEGEFYKPDRGTVALSLNRVGHGLMAYDYAVVRRTTYGSEAEIAARDPLRGEHFQIGQTPAPGDVELLVSTTLGGGPRHDRFVFRKVGEEWKIAEWATRIVDRSTPEAALRLLLEDLDDGQWRRVQEAFASEVRFAVRPMRLNEEPSGRRLCVTGPMSSEHCIRLPGEAEISGRTTLETPAELRGRVPDSGPWGFRAGAHAAAGDVALTVRAAGYRGPQPEVFVLRQAGPRWKVVSWTHPYPD